MIDQAVNEISKQMHAGLKRAEAAVDHAVRILDSVTPTEDFVRLCALEDSAKDAEVWLARTLGFYTSLDALQHPDGVAKARATATHTALQEVWVEIHRLRDHILSTREAR